MVKLQHISWATILLILSPVGINISSASNISQEAESKAIAMETYQLAQQQEGDDEMLDALQKRQENIDKLDIGKVRKLTKTKSQYSLPPTVAFRMLAIGLPAIILVFLIGKPIVRGILGVF